MLTYEELSRQYGPGANPRWVRCHAELGRRPTLGEFTLWLGERKAEFSPVPWQALVDQEGDEVQRRFDDWLSKRALHAQV